MTKALHSSTLVGWREWVSLPGIGIPWIKAKIDTGARTSALHAFDIETDGDEVRFFVHPWQSSDLDEVEVVTEIHDRRLVRSSSGHEDERIVVLMDVAMAGRVATVEMTLTNRDPMGFRMLIGRQALRGAFVVDPALSFVGGRPPRAVRRANRGL